MRIVTSAEFQQVISEGVVLVDFFANWCGPCKMLSPVLESLAEDYQGKVEIVKVDVDQSPELAGQFGVESIPNLFLFKDGKPVAHTMGFQSRDNLEEFINSVL